MFAAIPRLSSANVGAASPRLASMNIRAAYPRLPSMNVGPSFPGLPSADIPRGMLATLPRLPSMKDRPKSRSAWYWLWAAQRSSMFSDACPPPIANGFRWWNSTLLVAAHRCPRAFT
jgi:hypothetical protein